MREPAPTQLQREYVLAGRRAATRRQRITLVAVLAALGVAAALALVALLQRSQAMDNERRAVANERTARSRELAASAVAAVQSDPDLGLLLARESVRVEETPEAVEGLRRALDAAHLEAVLRGAQLSVERVAFTADGHAVVGGSNDGKVRAWDARTGRELGAVENHPRPGLQTGDSPTIFAVAPVGHAVASTGFGGSTVTVWDARDGRVLGATHGLQQVHALEFAPDGRRLAIGSGSTARVWDWRSRRTVRVLRRHRRLVTGVRFSGDGTRLVTASLDGTAAVWDTRSGRRLTVVGGGLWEFRDVSFGAKGDRLVTVDANGTARLWNATGGAELAAVGGGDFRVVRAVLSPNGRVFATGSEDGAAHVWSVAGGRRVAEFGGHDGGLTELAFHPSSTIVASASVDGTARLWSARTGDELSALRGHGNSLAGVAFSRDGRRAATASADGTARVWRVEVPRPLFAMHPHGPGLSGVAFAPEGTLFATFGDSLTRLWQAPSGERVTYLEEPDQVDSVEWARGAAHLVTMSADGTTRIWATKGPPALAVLQTPGNVQPPVVAAGGTHVLTYGFRTTAFVWSLPEGKLVARLPGHREVSDAALSADATRAVTVGYDYRLARIWDVRGRRVLGRLGGTRTQFDSVAFSPDGRRIVAIVGRRLQLWDVDRRTLIRSVRAPDAGDARFTPDGTAVLTTGGSTRLRDAGTLRLRATLGARALDPVFSGDGRLVLTTTGAVVDVWDVRSGLPVARFEPPDGVLAAGLSADGRYVVAGVHSGATYVYACDICRPVDDLAALADERATRELTADERSRYLHE